MAPEIIFSLAVQSISTLNWRSTRKQKKSLQEQLQLLQKQTHWRAKQTQTNCISTVSVRLFLAQFFLKNKNKKNNCATQIVLKELQHTGTTLKLLPCSAQQPENHTRKKIRLPYKCTSPIFGVHIPHTNHSPLKKMAGSGGRQEAQIAEYSTG